MITKGLEARSKNMALPARYKVAPQVICMNFTARRKALPLGLLEIREEKTNKKQTGES